MLAPMKPSAGTSSEGRLIAVAVPLPIEGPLTYRLPENLAAMPGCRVKVRVGKRLVTGVVLKEDVEAPEGVSIRAIERVVDPEPVLGGSLLELANFVAEYYLAPIGEVLQSILPSNLEPWGERRVWLTDAGALGLAHTESESVIIESLRESGRLSLAQLQSQVDVADFSRVIQRLAEAGKVAIAEARASGSRFTTAIELRAGDVEDLLERCGRSKPAREVVEYLAALGRPSTVQETLTAAGCGRSVVTRLVKLDVLRQFSQLSRLDLDRHVVGETKPVRFELNPGQQESLEGLLKTIDRGIFEGFLLRGLTGSGKTEVYLRAAERVLESGRGVIVLVPEIALVPVLASTLRQRFGDQLAMLHSGLGRAERQQEWLRIRQGEARVVLGPRSAVFAPVADLGLIVVDEEQDSAYKQETTPRYHARDIALYRGRSEGAVVVLASATPSLESRANVERQKLSPLLLSERVGGGTVPEGVLVDLRQEKPQRPGDVQFSPRLMQELEATLAAGDQAIILRNRRGYSPLLLCRACADNSCCDDCGLPRTYHRRFNELLCHYCGSRRPVPERCPACGEEALEAIGSGTERVEELLTDLLPGVAIDTLDRDTLRRQGRIVGVLERFAHQETQVLVGTQMVSKGHHFPRVALAVVLQADTYLSFPDFRAVERTYALLTQLAGRAGRGTRPGKVVIQSLRMVQLLIRDGHRGRAEKTARQIGEALERHPLSQGVRVLGPAPAPFERLRGKWRFQLLLRAPSGARVRALVRSVMGEFASSKTVVDVDPLELL
jgi:primosomal protein N' (replication factor Y)